MMHLNTDQGATEPPPERPFPPAPVPDEPYYRRGEQSRRWGVLLVLLGVVLLVFALSSRVPLFGIGFIERTARIEAQSFAAERVVLSGGSALPAGFRDRFEKLIQEALLPVQFSEIRLASDPLYATAKGALVAALAD